MQDATAQLRPNQHPKTSPTQQSSYVAPQTAAQAPSVATSPQWVAPTQPATGSSTTSASPDGGTRDPIQPYAVSAPDTAGNPTSGEPIQGRIQQGGRTPEFTSSIPVPGSTVSSELKQQTKPITDTNKQPHTATGVSRLICLRATTARHTPTIIPKLLRR